MGTKTRAPGRLAALDGLRGIAAVIVVAWHAVISTTLAAYIPMVLASGPQRAADAAPGTLPWFIFDTPLRLLTMGTNAVSIFFVLSGFVLTLPLFRGRALDLWSYYPRRIIRLWVPAAVSVVFALVLILLTRQDPADAASAWGASYSFERIIPSEAVKSFFLITGTDVYNNPLWSLRWELLFSLFLPAAFLLALRLRIPSWTAIVACALASGAGAALGVGALHFGPMFLAGVWGARLYSRRVAKLHSRQSWICVLGGFALIAVPDMARTLAGVDPTGRIGMALTAFVVFGAALVIHGLTIPSGITTLFASAPARFLGRISFSLYLVHAPLILAGVHVFGSAAWALLATVPLAFVVAWAFTRWIEDPSARLARTVGERCSAAIQALVPKPSPVKDATEATREG